MGKLRKWVLWPVRIGLILWAIGWIMVGWSNRSILEPDTWMIAGASFIFFGLIIAFLGWPSVILSFIFSARDWIAHPVIEERDQLLMGVALTLSILLILVIGGWTAESALLIAVAFNMPFLLTFFLFHRVFTSWIKFNDIEERMFKIGESDLVGYNRGSTLYGHIVREPLLWVCDQCFSLVPVGDDNCWNCDHPLKARIVLETVPEGAR